MKRWLFVVVVATVLGFAVVATAGAAGTTTYHGVFSGPVVYKGCGGTAPTEVASGTGPLSSPVGAARPSG